MVIFHKAHEQRRYPHGDISPSPKNPYQSYSYFTPQQSNGWVHDSDSLQNLRFPITRIPYWGQEQEYFSFKLWRAPRFFFCQEKSFDSILYCPCPRISPFFEQEKDDYSVLLEQQAKGRQQRREKIDIYRHKQAQLRKYSKRDDKISTNAQKRMKICNPANQFTRIRSKR